jgi:hypothetical protein
MIYVQMYRVTYPVLALSTAGMLTEDDLTKSERPLIAMIPSLSPDALNSPTDNSLMQICSR